LDVPRNLPNLPDGYVPDLTRSRVKIPERSTCPSKADIKVTTPDRNASKRNLSISKFSRLIFLQSYLEATMALSLFEPFRDDFFSDALRSLATASSSAMSGEPATYGRGILMDIKEVNQLNNAAHCCLTLY
jgi:hypothetical protein